MSMFKFIRSPWYRRNEKKIWIALTAVIALTFGVTGFIGDLGSSPRDRFDHLIYGKRVDPIEFGDIRNRWTAACMSGAFRSLFTSRAMSCGLLEWQDMFALAGYRGSSPREREDIMERLVWDVYVLQRVAERHGVRVGDEDVRDFIRTAVDQEKNSRNRGQPPAADTGFDQAIYKEMLKGFGLSAMAYEHTVRELLGVQRLMGLLRDSVRVEDEEVWRSFVEDNKKATGIVIPFEHKTYADRAQIRSFDEVAAFFREHASASDAAGAYRIPKRVEFEYLLVDEEQVKATIPDSTPEEIQKEYDIEKDGKFMNPAAMNPVPPGQTPPPRYQPIEQVRGDIVVVLRNRAYLVKVGSMFAAVKTELLEHDPQDVSWEASARKVNGFTWGVTPAVEAERLEEVLGKIFNKPGATPGQDSVHQLASSLEGFIEAAPDEDATMGTPGGEKLNELFMARDTKVGRGDVIARVRRVEKSTVPVAMTEDLRTLAERDLKKEKGRADARREAESLKEAVQRAETEERKTQGLETLAGADKDKKAREILTAVVARVADQAHCPRYDTGPVKATDKIDSMKSMDPSDSTQLSKTLGEMTPGELRVAEVNSAVCVVAMLEQLPPDTDDYLARHDQLANQVRSRKMQEVGRTWIKTFRVESGAEAAMAAKRGGT